MNMSEYIALCKQKSYELKETHPNLKHFKLLDLAAQELGFKHFTTIVNLEKILPPDEAPSHVAIVMAGGNADDSPYKQVSNSYTINSSNAVPVSSSVTSNQSKAIPLNTSVTSNQSNAIPMNSSVTSNQSNAIPVSNGISNSFNDDSQINTTGDPKPISYKWLEEDAVFEVKYSSGESEFIESYKDLPSEFNEHYHNEKELNKNYQN